MPGAGTHATIIQHLAQESQTFRNLLGDPTLNASWNTYHTDPALLSRYAVLGAMGPDIFYAMLDYGGDIQKFEDVLIKVAGTFECVGEISAELNQYIDGTLNEITLDAWDSIKATVGFLAGILKDGLLDLLIDKHNFWALFLPLRQVDDYRQNWYWADFLHYVKTGCFTQKLLDKCQTYSSDPRTTSFLKAYSLGYLTHYVADTVGHAYVNRIVESPWRNCWQRHHLVENFIDAYVWDHWHDPEKDPLTVMPPSTEEKSLDTIISQADADDPSRKMGDGASLHYARLNDLCNIGSVGVDQTIDKAISSVCESIQKGLFDIGASNVPTLQPPDDPAFTTWANFMADCMWEVYPPTTNPPNGLQDHPTKLSRNMLGSVADGLLNPCLDKGGYPSADDVIGAYGVYRLVLSLATEEDVNKPEFPDILGDLTSIVTQLWNSVTQALGGIPPPPSVPSSGGFSLSGLWDAIKSYAGWLGDVAKAVVEAVGAIIVAAMQADKAQVKEEIKVALWLLNSALYALYESVRMTLVMSAYSVPFTDELTGKSGPLDLTTLWRAPAVDIAPPYPIEPVLSERDLPANSSHPFSPYRPFFQPSTLQPVNIEMPATAPPAPLLRWSSPDHMLEMPIGKDVLLSVNGPAPATTAPLMNPDGTLNANLETFDGSKRYFGGIFANCEAALNAALPHVASGIPMPAGTFLPDYNMDSDRGYAWPCWDVDYTYPSKANPFPWNGCDPFPDDTKTRVNLSTLQGGLDWGQPLPPPATLLQPSLAPIDPFGNHRNGTAFVNATALSAPGACVTLPIPFPFITIDTSRFAALDPCSVTINPNSQGPFLPFDYQFVPSQFRTKAANGKDDPDDVITDPKTGETEHDGRLHDFLRSQAQSLDPMKTLANAVTLSLGMGTTSGLSPIPVDPALVSAVAQLAVTGRASGKAFMQKTPQDADLIQKVKDLHQGANFNAGALATAAHTVLDTAYTALWSIRGNVSGWRKFRATNMGWIAVSGFDDTPHRPVNVPTAPYPQFDIEFDVPRPKGGTEHVVTRYMVASARTYIGPNDPSLGSFDLTSLSPANKTLLEAPAPAMPFSATPAPRAVPSDLPTIPAGNEIIVYIHGGGSRAEEAVGLAMSLIIEGNSVGKNYTVVSFDLPNSAYAQTFEITDVVGSYDPSKLQLVQFEQDFIIGFIEALDAKLGNVKNRVVAVMGGSLGGNMSVLLSGRNDASHKYLNTIVSWSVTAMCPGAYLGIISNGFAGAYLGGLKAAATDSEAPTDHKTESTYITNMYYKPLIDHPPLPYTPPQPIMWYRADPNWQACKNSDTAQSRFDRYEIYSKLERHWISAIDLEQVYLSFQDNCRFQSIAASPDSRIMLCAGDKDNFQPNAIFNSTIEVARMIKHTAHGKAEFWTNTGHSFHDERPNLFAKEIVYFLNNLDAGDSPNGTVTSPSPAAFSETDK